MVVAVCRWLHSEVDGSSGFAIIALFSYVTKLELAQVMIFVTLFLFHERVKSNRKSAIAC